MRLCKNYTPHLSTGSEFDREIRELYANALPSGKMPCVASSGTDTAVRAIILLCKPTAI